MENAKPVLVHVEKDIYDEIMKHLGRDISFSDKVREWMAKELESINMEKNVMPQTDPLNLSKVLVSCEAPAKNRDDMSYDIYKLTEQEARQHAKDLRLKNAYDVFKKYTPIAQIYVDEATILFKAQNYHKIEEMRERKKLGIKIDNIHEYHVPMGLD